MSLKGGGRFLIEPAPFHFCPAPTVDRQDPGPPRAAAAAGAVWECGTCGQRWTCRLTDGIPTWWRLSWWHFAANKALREAGLTHGKHR